jgi:hypothetical protein
MDPPPQSLRRDRQRIYANNKRTADERRYTQINSQKITKVTKVTKDNLENTFKVS